MASQASVVGKRILIVDDNKELRDVLALACTQRGFAVEQASSYDEAQAQLARTKPDAILCDIMMPGNKNGMDFAKDVRSHEATRDITIGVMTDSNNMNYIADAALANITLYIQKADTDPFQIAEQMAQKVNA